MKVALTFFKTRPQNLSRGSTHASFQQRLQSADMQLYTSSPLVTQELGEEGVESLVETPLSGIDL